MKKYIVFVGIGFELVGLILGSYYIGNAVDAKYHTGGLTFVGLSLICLIGWLVKVIWLINRIQKNENQNK